MVTLRAASFCGLRGKTFGTPNCSAVSAVESREFSVDHDSFLTYLPSGYVKIAIENGQLYPIIVDCPIKNGDFP